jgi:IclR family acetate operon transcriptional repressor
VRSVRTTFQLLEAVADLQPIGLSELARKSGVPKSTVQRGLNTLAELGWVRSDGREPTRWMLGDRVRLLNERLDDHGRLREIALPYLQQLNSSTLETVHLAVLDGATVRLIERVDSKHPLRLVQPIGSRSPLHASSNGKGVLSRFTESALDAYIEHGLSEITEHTITDPEALRKELAIIRDRGYAIANQELISDIISVSAPIVDEDDRPIAGISVSGPVPRMKPRLLEEYGTQVVTAVAAISKELRESSVRQISSAS